MIFCKLFHGNSTEATNLPQFHYSEAVSPEEQKFPFHIEYPTTVPTHGDIPVRWQLDVSLKIFYPVEKKIQVADNQSASIRTKQSPDLIAAAPKGPPVIVSR